MLVAETRNNPKLNVNAQMKRKIDGHSDSDITQPEKRTKPEWHAPWKLYRNINGHLGWVKCGAIEPGNQLFASGGSDQLINIWELATGTNVQSLSGHTGSIGALQFSERRQHLFSCSADTEVKCWDMECNKVISNYHGHQSAVYSLALHPSTDLLMTVSRDSTARVWDTRTSEAVHILKGHTDTVVSVICQENSSQIITGSYDKTIKLWDLQTGRSKLTLNHNNSVEALTFHPEMNSFASASLDNIKTWSSTDGKLIREFTSHKNTNVSCLAASADGILVSCDYKGIINFWDWKTLYNFQSLKIPVDSASGSIEAIFSATFDMSGTRLITTHADETIKLFKIDHFATEETHPITWKPDVVKKLIY